MPDLALLIISCDKYDDLWPAYFQLFHKYWTNCSIPVYFCSDTKKANYEGVNSIAPGEMLEWSGRLKWALEAIKEQYVLIVLDDYYLISQVNEAKLLEYTALMKKDNITYLRIYPVPGGHKPYQTSTELNIIDKSAPYRTSTQASIWNRQDLIDFILPEESVWDFELIGTERSRKLDKLFLSVSVDKKNKFSIESNYAYNYLCTAVYKGKWMREILTLIKKENLDIDFGRRPLESRFEWFYRKNYHRSPRIIKHVFDFVRNLPNRLNF